MNWLRSHLAEVILSAVFAVPGIVSLLSRLGTRYQASSPGEQVLYLLHVTARVGLWFAFAGFFLGYALVDEPQAFRWYLFVPLGLAAVQFLTGVLLSRSPDTGSTPEYRRQVEGKVFTMRDAGGSSGTGAGRKRGESSDPEEAQPEAAEVESARLLANQAREPLAAQGLSDDQIRRLADEFIALGRGNDLNGFVGWAKEEGRGRL